MSNNYGLSVSAQERATSVSDDRVYFPGGFAFIDDKFDLAGLQATRGFLLKSGRAIIAPIYKGLYERHYGLKPGGTGANPPAGLRDHFVAWSKDLARSIDYLETRKEIDATKIGYFGGSLGGTMGRYLPAIEKRINGVVFTRAFRGEANGYR